MQFPTFLKHTFFPSSAINSTGGFWVNADQAGLKYGSTKPFENYKYNQSSIEKRIITYRIPPQNIDVRVEQRSVDVLWGVEVDEVAEVMEPEQRSDYRD